MSWVDKSGLQYFLSKLRSNIKISESRNTYTTTSTGTVTYTVPNFNSSTMTLDVYINGLHCIPTTDYTVNGNVVTIVNELEAGQICEFVVRKVTL